MQGRIWTVSNGLSFLRVLLIYPIISLLSSNNTSNRLSAALLILIAVGTDFFDGLVARKLNQVSDIGKIIDPIADKIGISAVMIVLTTLERLPVWLLIIALSRDVIIFLGGLYVQRVRGVILQSTMVGKWAAASLAFLILGTVLDFPWLRPVNAFLLVACVVLMAISFALYARRFFALLSQPKSQ